MGYNDDGICKIIAPVFYILITPHLKNVTIHHMSRKRQNAAFIEDIAQLHVGGSFHFRISAMLIIEDSIVTVKFRTVIHAPLLCFNVCLSVK